MTRSLRVHHVMENIFTLWMQPDEHILPLRIFLENIFNIDLQQRTVGSYAQKKMLQQKITIPVRLHAAV